MSTARRAAVVLGLVLGLGLAPAESVNAQAALATYQASSQTLLVSLPSGVVPTLGELANPPRLVIDLPGMTAVVAHSEAYAAGIVARYDLVRSSSGARVTLTLRQPLKGQYRVGFEGAQLRITLVPRYVAMATPRPWPTPTLPPIVNYPPPSYEPAYPPPSYEPTYPPPSYAPAYTSPSYEPPYTPPSYEPGYPPPAYATVAPRYPTPFPAWTPNSGMATPRPHAHPMPTPATVVSASQAPRTPTPSLAPVAVVPTQTPTPTQTPEPAALPFEPLIPVVPVVELPTNAVFGSRLSAGAFVPLTLTQTYPLGKVDATVAFVPGGELNWDVLFAPNFGSSVQLRALGYTFSDQAAEVHGLTLLHQRDEYAANLGIFGRYALPFGFEVMGAPGILLKTVRVSSSGGKANAGALTDLPVTASYLSSGWLGIGGGFKGGLGWRVFGPLVVAATGDVAYVSGGKMESSGVPSIFPMLGYKFGGEARLDLGGLGLALGYELGHDGHAGATPDDQLNQDWNGPTGRLSWLF